MSDTFAVATKLPAPASPTRGWGTWTSSAPALATVAVVLGMSMATYSVVRFRIWIVAGYVLAAIALTVVITLKRRPLPRPSPAAAGLGLLAAALGTWVPTWTYMSAGPFRAARLLISLSALTCGLLLLWADRRGDSRWRARLPALILGLAGSAHLAATAIAVRADPAPSIDVWYTLQAASDAMAEGQSWYRETWIGPPGVMSAFTYLPWTVVLLAPFRWLFGDVRWGIAAAGLVAALAIAALPGRRPRVAPGRAGQAQPSSIAVSDRLTASGYAALVLLLPGTLTQLEQAWTEPLLLACLSLALLAWSRDRAWLAALSLALGMGSKQHLVLLLPLLAAWPRIGLRRVFWLALTCLAVMLPWLVLDARDLFSDAFGVLVRYPPMRFANSLYIAVLNHSGVALPLWATGLVLIGVTAAVLIRLRRLRAATPRWIAAGALVLLVASLVNKQAFYNQYWLVAALCLLALASTTLSRGSTALDGDSASSMFRGEPEASGI